MSTVRQDIVPVGLNAGNFKHRTDAASTDINAGEPVNYGGALTSGASASNYAFALTDGKPLIGTDQFAGIASEDSDHTASVDGVIYVTRPIPQHTLLRGKASTTGNIDTDAELLAILYDAVTFGLASGVYTIDENDAANAAGLMIVDGSVAKGTLDVVVDARAMRKDVS